jgi:hypothetical protein
MSIKVNRAMRTLCFVLPMCCLIVPAMAQDEDTSQPPVRGHYVVLPPRITPSIVPPAATPLKTWNGSFTYHSTPYPYVMVGTAPSTGTATTITTLIVPIKVVITKGTTHTTFDPNTVVTGTKTAVTNSTTSPVFDKTTTYKQGTINVGTTQYVDAYQRANFWQNVQSHTGYHVYLSAPTVLPTQTLSPPASLGVTGTPFGVLAGEVDINWFDTKLEGIIAKFPQILPNTLVIFETFNVYLTQGGGYCIGGYHTAYSNANGIQTYMHFDYVNHPGIFSQDVSALTHEVGEWMDDPLTNGGNNSPCGLLENGDPLENGQPGHPYGDWNYTLNGFIYHLQDLATLPYFGAPIATSVNGWLSFHNAALSVCSNGS